MVNLFLLLADALPDVLPDAEKQTVLERLDPERRVAVILALVALGLLGALLIVVAMLAGRWARQRPTQRGSRLGQPTTGSQLAAMSNESKDADLPPNHGETLANQSGRDDTKS